MGHSRMSPNIRPSWYERHVLPYLIDIACGMQPVWYQRHKIVPLAKGCILEIGIGTGLNLEHYNKANIEKIVGLDPGLAMFPPSPEAGKAGKPRSGTGWPVGRRVSISMETRNHVMDGLSDFLCEFCVWNSRLPAVGRTSPKDRRGRRCRTA